ncbi:MAG: LacI family DNA-binding transcriptional regulator [Bacteroidetes bacterium]|nr:LacI family DNA-binding transcriptional regulator [Bacteroidota bacterium]
MNKRVSLKDVAQHVGVSIALVSYVLNGQEKEKGVSPEMTVKIRKAIAKLNYQPNLVAKGLKSGKSHTIGLIVADISNPFFSAIARVIEDEATKHGYVLIIGSCDENAAKSRHIEDVFLNRQVDALIMTPAIGSQRQIKDILKRKTPVVLIDRYFDNLKVDSVRVENYQAALAGVLHLINNGRRRIAMVTYRTELLHFRDRREGYKAALAQNDIPFNPGWIVEGSYEKLDHDIATGLGQLLRTAGIDAIFFANNTLAVAGLKVLNALGIKVPDQVAVVSFDESEAFDLFYSPVTYIRQPIEAIGKEAVRMAIDRIQGSTADSRMMTIPATFIVRESSGSK